MIRNRFTKKRKAGLDATGLLKAGAILVLMIAGGLVGAFALRLAPQASASAGAPNWPLRVQQSSSTWAVCGNCGGNISLTLNNDTAGFAYDGVIVFAGSDNSCINIQYVTAVSVTGNNGVLFQEEGSAQSTAGSNEANQTVWFGYVGASFFTSLTVTADYRENVPFNPCVSAALSVVVLSPSNTGYVVNSTAGAGGYGTAVSTSALSGQGQYAVFSAVIGDQSNSAQCTSFTPGSGEKEIYSFTSQGRYYCYGVTAGEWASVNQTADGAGTWSASTTWAEVSIAVQQPPDPTEEPQVYNAIQYAQDYLTRLEKINPGGSAALSEYPGIPLWLNYSTISTPTVSVFSVPGLTFNRSSVSISVNFIGETSESFTYSFTDAPTVCGGPSGSGGYSQSPSLNVTAVYEGHPGSGPTFEIKYTIALLAMVQTECNAQINFAGTRLGVVNSTTPLGTTFKFNTTVDTYAANGGNPTFGFDFGAPGSGNSVLPNNYLGSFRYTTRSGLQSAVEWSEGMVQYSPVGGSLWYPNTVWNELHNLGFDTKANGGGGDVYAPEWYRALYRPLTEEDNASAGQIYQDCYYSPGPPYPVIVNNGQLQTAYGAIYAYESKVCAGGVGTYLGLVWGQDPLVMSEVAIQVLLTRGPNYAGIPWHGKNVTSIQYASDLLSSGWVVAPANKSLSPYPAIVAYPSVCSYNCLTPNKNITAGDRVGVVAEFYTLLGYYWEGSLTSAEVNQFQTVADDLIQTIIDTQWGTPAGTAGSSTNLGMVEVQTNSETNLALFRPQDIGGQAIAWNTTDGVPMTPSSLLSTFVDMLNMPKEYAGYLPTNQEATQESLAALLTYYNLVDNPPAGPGSELNDGVQPFTNFLLTPQMANSSLTTLSRTFSLNDVYPSGSDYTLYVDMFSQLDSTNHTVTVYVDGSKIKQFTIQVPGTNYGSNFETAIPLPALQSNVEYNLTITISGAVPSGTAWILDAAVQDPPANQYLFANVPEPGLSLASGAKGLELATPTATAVGRLVVTWPSTWNFSTNPFFGNDPNYPLLTAGHIFVLTSNPLLQATVTPALANGVLTAPFLVRGLPGLAAGTYTVTVGFVYGQMVFEETLTVTVG